MIRIISAEEVLSAAHDGWKVLVIVREPGEFLKTIEETSGVFWIPELSPAMETFDLYLRRRSEGNWNKDVFVSEYLPSFLDDLLASEQAQCLMEKLRKSSEEGERIALACFCTDETICHRSIVSGILQGMGCQVQGNDYSAYYKEYLLHRKASQTSGS